VTARDAETWLRRGNAAFERGDYAEAIDDLTRAEDFSTDPGLVAGNKAAALYRLGQYREAELHYLRCLEDAVGERRVRTLFDLGNTLVQQSEGTDAAMLDRAIASYEACLQMPDVTPELRADAQHNLRLALALRRKAKDVKKPPSTDPSKPPKPEEEQRPPLAHRTRETAGGPDPHGTPQGTIPGETGQDENAQGTSQRQPGAGNLPPVPDSDELKPLAPEDARAHLRQATARIMTESHRHKQRASRPTRNVLDW
jgi:tetratricopeptide (TPR) repeat protein